MTPVYARGSEWLQSMPEGVNGCSLCQRVWMVPVYARECEWLHSMPEGVDGSSLCQRV